MTKHFLSEVGGAKGRISLDSTVVSHFHYIPPSPEEKMKIEETIVIPPKFPTNFCLSEETARHFLDIACLRI